MSEPKSLASIWNSLLKKKQLIGAKAQELISTSEEGKCSFEKGYITQDLYLCKTCSKSSCGSGICIGCYLACHIDHDVAEVGPKRSFRCDCGNPRMSNSCKFQLKEKENEENLYNHNFLGKFCVCSQEDSDERDCDMFMCVGCYDWFHFDCIQINNECHNHSETRSESVPGIPEDPENYYFLCCQCLKEFKFIPAGYKDYIFFEAAIKRPREGCPLTGRDLSLDYPYHIFLEKNWVQDRCRCENCLKIDTDEVFKYAEEMEKRKGLLERINEESERIMQAEDCDQEEDDSEFELDGLTHESKIHVANGIQVLKETIDEIALTFHEGAGEEIAETFQKRLKEKYEAYKKAKLSEDSY